MLRDKPQDYGISPSKLDEDFDAQAKEPENALVTAVTHNPTRTYFRQEIKTAGGEGGTGVLEVVRKALREEGELVTADDINQSLLAVSGTPSFQLGIPGTIGKEGRRGGPMDLPGPQDARLAP